MPPCVEKNVSPIFGATLVTMTYHLVFISRLNVSFLYLSMYNKNELFAHLVNKLALFESTLLVCFAPLHSVAMPRVRV